MQETKGNISSLLGQIVQTFGDIRVAETQAELNQLQFVEGSVTARPEDTVDESAASVRNLFDLDTGIGRANAFATGAAVIGLILVAGLTMRMLKK